MRPVRRLLVLLCAATALSTGHVSPAAAAGDDYPWRHDRTWGSDAYGFTVRQCVSFVAWRTAQQGHVLRADSWGSAHEWDNAARRLGVGIGSRPVVGAVAHWNALESSRTWTGGRASGTMRAGGDGHVAYVEQVHPDGSATVTHYNGDGRRTFSRAQVRAPRYLYAGVPGAR